MKSSPSIRASGPRSTALRLYWLPLLFGLLAGCAQPSKLPAETPMAPSIAVRALAAPETPAPLFRFSPGDEADLRVPDAPQFDVTVKVRPDGFGDFPVVGSVRMQDRTVDQVQKELRELFDRSAGEASAREYLLQPNDEIEIKFPYQAQFNESVKLRPDGKIQLQLVGTVQADGLSPEELQKDLVARYARYLRRPELAVIVRSTSTQSVKTAEGSGRAGMRGLKPVLMVRSSAPPQVFVGGEVLRPGVLAYRPGLSLLQAMVEAGGRLPSGDVTQLVVLRRGPSESVELLQVGFDDQATRAPTRDILLQPYDVVMLPKTGVATLADNLNQYVYNLVPFLRNSSIGAYYNVNGNVR